MANELDTVRELIDGATSGMTEEMLRFHPDGKWCSAEIVEHLALSYSGTAKGMSKVLEAGKPLARRRSLRDFIFQTSVLTFEFFPSGRKAPKMVVPTGALSGTEALQKIRSDLESMAAKIAEVEKLLGGTLRVLDHPILGPLSVSGWRHFHLAHTRHHMKQVKALRGSQLVVQASGASAP